MLNADFFTRVALAFVIIIGGFGIYLFYNWTLRLRTPSLLAELGPIRPPYLHSGVFHYTNLRPMQNRAAPGDTRS